MGTILIVDDEASIRHTLKAFLEKENHLVDTARDAFEALEKLKNLQVDIVLTDIILPRMSGVDLLREVRVICPETLVLMMTGEPTLDTAAQCLRLGAMDYLQKPVTKKNVLKAVDKALGVKAIRDEKRSLEKEKKRYTHDLEQLVEDRTRKLAQSESILRKRAEELSILNNLARRVNSSVTVSETVHSGLEEVRKAVSADIAICFHLENGSGINRIVYPENSMDSWRPETARWLPDCLCGFCLREKNAVYSKNIHTDSRCTLDACKKAGVQSVAALPLKSGPELLGVLCLASTKNRDFRNQATFLESLTNEISIGLKKSLLYEKLQQQAEELQNKIIQIKETEAERSKLQIQLQKSQKMEAIGTLAAGIAHDFNNILAAIIGYSELAMLDLPAKSNSAEKISLSLAAADRAKDMVKQILAFSRQVEPETRPVNMARVTKEVIKFLRASLPSTIQIHENINKQIPNVMADPVQLNQIIMNLCTNAGHAMKDSGGVLGLCLDRVRPDKDGGRIHPELKAGEYARLTVSDTGHGISQTVMDRIFEPYFTTKEMGEGTGLGLAVTHGIIKKYEGVITVESEPGKGAVFTVYLPVISAEETQDLQFKESIPKGNERILLVDDEPTLVDIGRQMLEYMGYEVSARTNSPDALALFNSKPFHFDLVLTDMTMPHMTGIALAEKIREKQPDIPVILCTGFSENLRTENIRQAGIKAVLMKPLDMLKLSKTIRAVLDSGANQELPIQAAV